MRVVDRSPVGKILNVVGIVAGGRTKKIAVGCACVLEVLEVGFEPRVSCARGLICTLIDSRLFLLAPLPRITLCCLSGHHDRTHLGRRRRHLVNGSLCSRSGDAQRTRCKRSTAARFVLNFIVFRYYLPRSCACTNPNPSGSPICKLDRDSAARLQALAPSGSPVLNAPRSAADRMLMQSAGAPPRA